MAPIKKQPNIAIVASRGLGDGLLFLIIANNLQKNGYQVTFYNNFVAQLQNWLPAITVQPYPDKKAVAETFAPYDFVLAERVSIITDAFEPSQYGELGKKYGFISCISRKFNPDLIHDNSKQLHHKIKDPQLLQKLLPLAKASGTMLPEISKTMPLAKTLAIFCQEYLQLSATTDQPGLVPPTYLEHRKNSKRVIIHPTSSNKAKNWAPKKFIKLAKLLRQTGWLPVFTLSAGERSEWSSLINNEFPMPIFTTINELAKFIYQSGVMIGNESGIGHLASALGIPTLTIAGTATKNLRWRPSWAYGELVNFPKIKIGKKKYWQQFIPVSRVRKQFNKFVTKPEVIKK